MTTTTHQNDATRSATPASASWPVRRRRRGGPATRYASAKAGTTMNAWSILVMNPKPTSAPAVTSHAVRPLSMALTVAYAAPTSSSVSSASGLLNRNIRAATGVTASTAPASRPAAPPNHRRTVAYSSPTAATPSSACGTRMLHALTPNRRAEISITHSAAGGLSTVIEPAASDAPKKAAFQLFVPACTAAE